MKKKRAKYFSTGEGHLFIGGLILGVIWICALFVFYLRHYDFAWKLLSMIATHLLAGRAGGISVGLECELPAWLIVVNATIIDSLIVLLAYPLFVLSYKSTIQHRFITDMLGHSIQTATKERKRVSRFGIVGLLFFVWMPLHMTGPLVGAIIGYFNGLNPYVNITVVLTGTFFAVVSWLILFHRMIDLAGDFSVLIPFFVIAMALVVFLVIKFKHRKETP